jgi:hypothetical protein
MPAADPCDVKAELMTTVEIETGVGRVERFSLGEEEVICTSPQRQIERRIPYWDISPNYLRRRARGKQEIPKMLCFLSLAGMFAYFAWIAGPLLWVLVGLCLIPVYAYGRRLRNMKFEELVFQEDGDGGWAFTIRFRERDAQVVFAWVTALQSKLESFSGRRRADRRVKREDADDEP